MVAASAAAAAAAVAAAAAAEAAAGEAVAAPIFLVVETGQKKNHRGKMAAVLTQALRRLVV